MKVVVIGSSNIDMVAQVSHLPAPGETVGDANFMQSLGGKGANQAVAAARLGGFVTFVTSLGNDMYADILKNHFKKENICDADKAHAGKHSAPRLKDVFRRFTSTHGKCERSKKNKYAHNDISFANFKKQLENLKQKNEPTYNRQQPPGGKVKQAFIE